MIPKKETTHTKTSYTIKHISIGCRDKDLLEPAVSSYLRGGMEAFVHFISQGYIFLMKGNNAILLDRTFTDVKVNHESPSGYIILWTSREAIE